MIFWLFVAISLVNDHDSFAFKMRLWTLALASCAIALGLDFLVFQWARNYFGASSLLVGRGGLASNVIEKMHWFFRYPLVDSLNFFSLGERTSLAIRNGIFVFLGLLLAFKGSLKERAALFTAALCLVPLAYLPSLLVAESISTYRTQFALGGLLTFYALVAMRSLIRLARCRDIVFSITIICFAAMSSLIAYANMLNFFALPQSLELSLLRAQMQGKFGENMSKHPLLLQERSDTLAPFVRYDEFGMPSAAQSWARLPMKVLVQRESAGGDSQ